MNAATSVDDNVRKHRQRRVEAHEANTGGKPADRRPGPRQADAGRWRTLNAFVDAALADCKTRAEICVWLVLFRDVKPGGLARVGMTDIARRAGLSRRAVVGAINGLKNRRLIEVVTRGSIHGSPNAYRISDPAP